MSVSGLVPGAIFAERYKIVRCIAHGGMGAVYEVIHLETERRRALKVMLPHVLASAELRQRFQREAKIAANVESDFIVDVFDAGFDDATQMPFLVMELLRGEEVSKRLKRLGRLSPAEVVAILHQTALALDKTHKASIVHRDLKPENLFLTEREDGPPRVKVLDFGIAKVVAESATTGGLTQSIGTPLFMAPEQFNPRAVLTGAADLYALAMVAYKLLVGRAYWAEESKSGNVFALAAVAIHGPTEPASARAAEHGVPLPPAFDAWFARATAVDPTRRFPSGAPMVAALAEAFDVGTSSYRGASGSPSLLEASSSHGLPTAAPTPARTSAPSAVGVSVPAGSLTLELPSVTCPEPILTSTSPSVPTDIAAPATSGTSPTPLRTGPGTGAVLAVAIGACGLLGVGAWFALRIGGGEAVPAAVQSSASGAASAPVAPPTVPPAPPPDLEPPARPSTVVASPPASATPAAAAEPTGAEKPAATPPATPARPPVSPAPPPPPAAKKKKYTRE